MKAKRSPRWTPRRKGRLYCSPACGRGCTWDEYQQAKEKGGTLVRRLGKGWKPVVHENLGWHFHAVSASGNTSVWQNGPRSFWATLNVIPQFTGDGGSPQAAIKAVMKEAGAYRDKLILLIEDLP